MYDQSNTSDLYNYSDHAVSNNSLDENAIKT